MHQSSNPKKTPTNRRGRVVAGRNAAAVAYHNPTLERIHALLDEVQQQQRDGREIDAKIDELRREIARALAPVSDSNDKSRRR